MCEKFSKKECFKFLLTNYLQKVWNKKILEHFRIQIQKNFRKDVNFSAFLKSISIRIKKFENIFKRIYL